MPVVDVVGVPEGEAYIDDPWGSVETMLCCLDGDVSLTGSDLPALEGAMASASYLLWKLSGEQYGLRTMTIRPCTETCLDRPPIGTGWTPTGSYVTRYACKSCPTGRCPCSRYDRVKIPRPTREILSVYVDGELLDPSHYRIDTRRRSWLIRTDGERWPTCQNWASDGPGDDGYFAVSLVVGKPVPSIGVSASAELACELFKLCADPESCQLPQRVTSYVRNGVTVPVIDVMEFIDKRRTGLYSVDMFLGAVNPAGLARRARAHSAEDL